MDYSSFSKDQQIQLLEGRITGWEAEHFGHEINLLALEANNATDQEKEVTVKSLNTLKKSIVAARESLNQLKATTDDNTSDS